MTTKTLKIESLENREMFAACEIAGEVVTAESLTVENCELAESLTIEIATAESVVVTLRNVDALNHDIVVTGGQTGNVTINADDLEAANFNVALGATDSNVQISLTNSRFGYYNVLNRNGVTNTESNWQGAMIRSLDIKTGNGNDAIAIGNVVAYGHLTVSTNGYDEWFQDEMCDETECGESEAFGGDDLIYLNNVVTGNAGFRVGNFHDGFGSIHLEAGNGNAYIRVENCQSATIRVDKELHNQSNWRSDRSNNENRYDRTDNAINAELVDALAELEAIGVADPTAEQLAETANNDGAIDSIFGASDFRVRSLARRILW